MADKDVVKQIRKATRRKFSAEEKIRIVLEGLRGEIPVTERCRRACIVPAAHYKWSKAFLDAGKNGLARETKRDATSNEIHRLTANAARQGAKAARAPATCLKRRSVVHRASGCAHGERP